METLKPSVVAVVQARMGSTRLPGKVLMEVGGRPLLELLLARLAGSRRISRSVVATTRADEDDAIVACAGSLGIEVIRGDEQDVLSRFLDAADATGAQVVVRITADCPLVDPALVDSVVDALLSSGADYASNIDPPTFPDGLDVEAMTASALRRSASLATVQDREHVTGALRRESCFRRVAVCAPSDESARRWTVDEAADLTVVRRIFSRFAPRTDFGWLDALAFVRSDASVERANLGIVRNEGTSMSHETKMARAAAASIHPDPMSADWQARLLRVIPGGAHTYSRGFDQFPANVPPILERGEGVYVWAPDGRRYLDFGMALASVGIGYGEPEIVEAAVRGMRAGNGLTRPSMVELQAAELLVSKVRSADMVKFTKNGSTAVTAAVKLARAHTGRDLVLRCAQHPFFSYDDWFIGSTAVQRGIPSKVIGDTLLFDFNDPEGLARLLDQHHGRVAAVVLEPATAVCPKPCGGSPAEGPIAGCCSSSPCGAGICGRPNFLREVQDLCRRHGALMVLDEMITGFRWDLGGAQALLGVEPDISTFGKAMANGFSVACVAGRREVMEHGSIEFEGRERVFLLSTTHGAEMCGLSAFVETVAFMERNDVCSHIWNWGARFITMFNEVSRASGTWPSVRAGGPACKPVFLTLGADGAPSMPLRTLFMQEMARHGVLMPQVTVAYRHGEHQLREAEEALRAALPVVAQGIADGAERLLEGPAVKPVFRRFN